MSSLTVAGDPCPKCGGEGTQIVHDAVATDCAACQGTGILVEVEA